jgi:uncharacterized protein (TIGR00297 family)
MSTPAVTGSISTYRTGYVRLQVLGIFRVGLHLCIMLHLSVWRVLLGIGVVGVIALRARRRKSLTSAGALAAFVVGLPHFYAGLVPFMMLLVFYFSSSKLTRISIERKSKLVSETGKPETEAFATGRTAVQVLCNGLLPALLCSLLMAEESWPGMQVKWSTQLNVMLLAHFSCCCADTWASEIGILAKGNPILITTGRPVPPGTNGGVSARGTLAAAGGGLAIGLGAAITSACLTSVLDHRRKYQMPLSQEFCEHAESACWVADFTLTAVWGLCFGMLGCMTDSLLGALFQFSGWDTERRCVVHHASSAHVKRICGANLLDNNAVNALSSLFTVAAASALAGAL